jgi:hypothetical protein
MITGVGPSAPVTFPASEPVQSAPAIPLPAPVALPDDTFEPSPPAPVWDDEVPAAYEPFPSVPATYEPVPSAPLWDADVPSTEPPAPATTFAFPDASPAVYEPEPNPPAFNTPGPLLDVSPARPAFQAQSVPPQRQQPSKQVKKAPRGRRSVRGTTGDPQCLCSSRSPPLTRSPSSRVRRP